ncbi:hypothetical protein HS125_12005 [bacterium]|nr:hypothetical protein [bacterium]
MLNRLLSAGLRRPFPKTSPIPRESLLVFAAAPLVFFIASALRPVMLNADYLFFARDGAGRAFLSPVGRAHARPLSAGYFRLLSLLFSIFPAKSSAGKALSIVCAAASTTLLYLLVMGLFGTECWRGFPRSFSFASLDVVLGGGTGPGLAVAGVDAGRAAFLLREPARGGCWSAPAPWRTGLAVSLYDPVPPARGRDREAWRYRVRHPAPWLALALAGRVCSRRRSANASLAARWAGRSPRQGA